MNICINYFSLFIQVMWLVENHQEPGLSRLCCASYGDFEALKVLAREDSNSDTPWGGSSVRAVLDGHRVQGQLVMK